jgi:prephenate dehydrogenase
MPDASPFRSVTILGTGLIGGSFALALRKHFPELRISGWDRPETLHAAESAGAIHHSFSGPLAPALAHADLVFIALPIGVTIDLLPEILRLAPPTALVTDAGSTKLRICERAEDFLSAHPGPHPLFLPGHPMAGREVSGIAAATADLFQNAPWALISDEPGLPAKQAPRVMAFLHLLERIGARPLWLGAQQHDYAVALSSHLPQLAAVALASFLHDRVDENGLPLTLAGPGLRDSLRLAGSPYSTWRDILLTNREYIAASLDLFARHLDDLRERLSSRDLENSFDAANELYKLLRSL